jgi:hypothetical protein
MEPGSVAGEVHGRGAAPSWTALARALDVRRLLTCALVGGIFVLALRPIDDPDLWWHLAAGDRILGGLGIPRTDPFSYVAGGNDWVAYSWFAEVLFAAVRRALGLGALVPLAAAAVAATFYVVLCACRAAGARQPLAVGVTLAAALVSSPSWTVRPHVFSFLAMAIFVHVLGLRRHHGRDRLWLLVPAMALWANTHILFPFGLVLLGAHLAEAVGRSWQGGSDRRAPRQLATALVAVAAVTLATPYGWRLLAHLWVMANQPVALGLVVEFQTPSLHTLNGQMLAVLFFATVAALVLSPRRPHAAELAAFFGFGWLAWAMARNIPFFAIVAAPILARHAAACLEALGARARRPAPAPRPATPPAPAVVLLHAALLAAGTAVAAGRAALLHPDEAAVGRTAFPAAAVRFLRERPVPGRLFNDFNWGGYLIGALYPHYRVSMDGRTQVYGEETLRQYRALIYLEPGWRAFLDRCDPDVILWPKDAPFVRALELLPEWRRVYADDLAVIFTRTTPRPAHAAALSALSPAQPSGMLPSQVTVPAGSPVAACKPNAPALPAACGPAPTR